MKQFFVYIMASAKNGTIYIGMTNDLVRRVFEHKNSLVDGFSKKYGSKSLVYFEQHDTADHVMTREKQMKKWYRKWKLELIEKTNPKWNDLYDTITQ